MAARLDVGAGAESAAVGAAADATEAERPPKPATWSSMTKVQKKNWHRMSTGKWR